MKKKLYKFMREGLKSESGDCTWELNIWKHEDKVDICNAGFHASQTPLQALGYVSGEILAVVEVKGQSEVQEDKECWSDMRIVKAYHWKKDDSIALSIFAAELCIKNYEKVYPNDMRPRDAIEAAKKWLSEPTSEKESAAESAAWSAWSAARSSARSAAESARSAAESAAWSAWSAARSSAWSAAESAWSAARSSARSAAESAWSAARSARSAARSARSAARSAAWSAESAARKTLVASLDKFMLNRITTLEEYSMPKK